MKVLILVLGCDWPEYNYILEEGITKTWNSVPCEGVEVYYYFGNALYANTKKNRINLVASEDYGSIGVRTLECFEYCLDNFEFDYIFRTNISSYVHKENLLKFLEGKPSTQFYSAVVSHYAGVTYGSGSGYTLSRDLVEELVKRKKELDISLVDDVAVGKLLSSYNITPAPRVDIPCEAVFNASTGGMAVTHPANRIAFNNNIFHYRCKCDINRQGDVGAMHIIHNLFKVASL